MKRLLPWLAVAAALMLVMALVPKPEATVFWGVTYNTGHLPLFGCGALALLWLSGRQWPAWTARRHYLLAWVGSGVLGVVSELSQRLQPGREADPMDVLHDLVGASVFLGLAAMLDARVPFAWVRHHPCWGVGLATLALGVNFSPIALVWLAIPKRDGAFPVLSAFDASWELWFIDDPGVHLSLVAPPESFAGAQGPVLRAAFGPVPSRLELIEPVPDWRGYQQLAVSIASPRPVTLLLVVTDGSEEIEPEALRIELSAGVNPLRLPLDALRPGGAPALDLSSIATLSFALAEPSDGVTLNFDQLRLLR